ncbi:Kinesin-16 [Spironucleus salmonicida]|uniref:Kinesin-16 n=1 Tax=Spironucleus salmonicida TaxID=348837 RepID=V6LPB5_9EUKA|nr:Kinesin-16 [Spironucleus salmonicida]|eukprot:EST45556.1 Kinesin-16 [Spironucleus salmonicida]
MSHITVGVRVRPMIKRELEGGQNNCLQVTTTQVVARESLNSQYDDQLLFPSYNFNFDQVYGPESTQQQVCEITTPTLSAFVQGVNGCILTYGQTASGKSFTIQNNTSGILPHALDYIFQNAKATAEVKISYLQIYNEQLLDLLDESSKKLSIRESKGEIYVENLSIFSAKSTTEALELIALGNEIRKTSETAMNIQSSRSHAVFTVYLNDAEHFSKLLILDLAGSERAHSSQKDVLRETKHINSSLAVLSNVLNALLLKDKNPKQFVPYRDSKLTRLLSDSLGKNCRSVILTTISPGNQSFSETINSLRFADRAKAIKQNGQVNQIESDEKKIQRYKNEIQNLMKLIQETKAGVSMQEDESVHQNVKISKQYVLMDENDNIINLQNEQQNEQLQDLRNISLKQKDIMITLTQKLQESEDEYQETILQIDQIQDRVENYVQQIAKKKQFLESKDIMNCDKINEKFIKEHGMQKFMNQQDEIFNYNNQLLNNYFTTEISDYEESMTVEQKYEELQHIKTEFSSKILSAQKTLNNIQQHSIQQQYKLEKLSDQIISDLKLSKTDKFSAQKLVECQQERRLMLKIFNEKVLNKLTDITPNEAVCLQNYLLKVCDAIETGQLFQSLNSLFK